MNRLAGLEGLHFAGGTARDRLGAQINAEGGAKEESGCAIIAPGFREHLAAPLASTEVTTGLFT